MVWWSFSDFRGNRKLDVTDCLFIQFGLLSYSGQVVVTPSLAGGMTQVKMGSATTGGIRLQRQIKCVFLRKRMHHMHTTAASAELLLYSEAVTSLFPKQLSESRTLN